MDDNGVMSLIEELSLFLESSKAVIGRPNLRQVDIQEALAILDEIRVAFPTEFNQARTIVRQGDELIEEAKNEANHIVEDARQQALTIASEQEIVRLSQDQAREIIGQANEIARNVGGGADQYADEVFGQMQANLDQLLNTIVRYRQRLNNPNNYGDQNQYEMGQ